MKSWHRRSAAALYLCVIGIAIAFMGREYFRSISGLVYQESADHLVEVYSQVNHNFTAFLERNWGNLDDWIHNLDAENEKEAVDYLAGRQKIWGFSHFYFLAPDGSYITSDGEKGSLVLKNVREALFLDGEWVMSNEILSTGQAVTVFAIPAAEGKWKDFTYSAIAISYTNADMINSLYADAFGGESSCFVIDEEGGVFLSTQQGGSVFGNYLSYLRAASNLNSQEIAKLQQDWKEGKSGAISCKMGGIGYYVAYQSIGYQGCVLLGIVPELAANASLLEIQRTTSDILVKVFFLVGASVFLWLVYSYRQKTKKSAMELKYRDMMFDTLSVNVNDIFLMLDAKTLHVDFVSSNVERLLGIPQKAVLENVGRLGESAAGSDSFISGAELAAIPIHGNRQWEQEHMHQGTGEHLWFQENIYHETIEGMEKYLIVMSDRTQERQMNRHLQDALDTAKNASLAKSRFLSNMSHDIRTPMNAIIGFSVLLEKDADSPEKVREYTRKISASGQHLLGLINDVLDMSKIESGKTSLHMSHFCLPKILEELYMILLPQAKAKGQAFEFHVQGKPTEQLVGDRLRLNQILINLLSNAVKYTQAGGRIDFLVQEMPKPSSQYSHLQFIVKDNGIGMSEEFLSEIFSPFSRESNAAVTSIQGTGLGMAITKNLVELMGGTISVESRLGEGSTFTVELSFAVSDAAEDDNFWQRRGIMRILVADDEESVCASVQSRMQDSGVEIAYVTDGDAAVRAAADAYEKGEAFQAILLDCKMPGTDGVEAARQIREKVPESVPILLLTAYDWSDIEEEARAAGIDSFLPKPFFVSAFRQAMEDLKPAADTASAGLSAHPLEGMKFLVAEDNELNAEILSEMLKMEGASCEVAVNGEKAVRMFEESKPGYFDMILMDVQMPVMGGYEATRTIRAGSHPMAEKIPILAMTANAFDEDVRDALKAGMNAHLSKPIDMDAVKAAIGRLKNKEGEMNG